MTWHPARFAGLRSLLLGSPGQGTDASLTPPSNPASGPAGNAYPPPNCDGVEQLGARRLVLLFESRKAKHLRQSRLAAQCEADLRRVTHQILGMGKCSDGHR